MNASHCLVALLLATAIVGCTPFVPVMNTDKIDAAERTQALNVRVFTLESGEKHPDVDRMVSEVDAYSCKFLLTDPPPSKGNALLQLQLKALRADANGIIDVTFDESSTDFGTNCWGAVHAHGVAVRFKE
jgi:hypothetical protein